MPLIPLVNDIDIEHDTIGDTENFQFYLYKNI